MNILMINGTLRKSSTYTIGKMIIDRAMKDGDTLQEIFLPRDMPEFCRGCGICIRDSEKNCPDYLMYMRRITRMIDEADLLVFTTPVFCGHATGQMKTLLDHYAYRFMVHRPEESMFFKQAVCVATGARAGMRSAVKDITDSLYFWGTAKVLKYGVAVGADCWEDVDDTIKQKIDEDLTKLVDDIELNKEHVRPSFRARILFYIMRYMHKKKPSNKADERYWEEKGWLGKVRPWKIKKEN